MNGQQAKRLRRLARQRTVAMAVKHTQEGNDVTAEDIPIMISHLYKQAKLAWKKLSNPKSLLWVDLSNTGKTKLHTRLINCGMLPADFKAAEQNSATPSDS